MAVGKIEPAGNFGVLVLAVNAQDLASVGRGELIACGVLQHVDTSLCVDSETQYGFSKSINMVVSWPPRVIRMTFDESLIGMRRSISFSRDCTLSAFITAS